MPEKIDLMKELKELYQPSAKAPVLVNVPEMQFLTLEGQGDPNTSKLYQDSVQSLYQLAYTLKFALKKAGLADFGVMPLEGLWWSENMEDFLTREKGSWQWRMMIAQPAEVTGAWVESARAQARAKKEAAPRLDEIRLESYAEGLSAQILYLGPYSGEGPTIQRLHAFALEQGCHLAGLHHEIYLGDPRRSVPEKLKTIIRQPVGR